MARFKKKTGGATPAISTSSLPDIVFMLLFFFMVATTMREVTLKVKNNTPQASELEKLTKKSLVSYIYIGAPLPQLQAQFGSAPRIQLNDAFKTKADIQAFVQSERDQLPEYDKAAMMMAIKADKDIKMGIITDVKQELRKANALKLTYSAKLKADEKKK